MIRLLVGFSAIGIIQDQRHLLAGNVGFLFFLAAVYLGDLEPFPEPALLRPFPDQRPKIVENVHSETPFRHGDSREGLCQSRL